MLIIDAMNLVSRYFHCPQDYKLLHLVGKTIDILKTYEPDYVVVALESKRSFRREMYPAYKANRAAKPDGIRDLYDAYVDVMRTAGIACVSHDGLEADDVIGSIAISGIGKGRKVYIISNDKDMLQLASDRVKIINTSSGSQNHTKNSFSSKTNIGLPPNQIIDYLALSGDPSDNIPGVPGIGPKTAMKLLKQFGSLRELIERVHEADVSDKVRKSIVEHMDQALMSYQLARIVTDVSNLVSEEEARFDLQDLRTKDFHDKLRSLDLEELIAATTTKLRGLT